MSERKIVVFENLPLGTTASDLKKLLIPLGVVAWSYIKAPEDGRHNHTGYAEMSTEKEAGKVIVKWNGVELNNHVLRVKYVPPNFDRATMGEEWRSVKPPSVSRTGAKSTLQKEKASRNDTDNLMVTSSLVREDNENKTVQYNRKDYVDFNPNLDKNSNYDEPEPSMEPKYTPQYAHPTMIENYSLPPKAKGFNGLVIISIVLVLIGLAAAIYFFWSKF